MFRLLMLVFMGGFRGTEDQEHHLHESPAAITFPLIVLAIFSLVGGFVQLPHLFGGHDFLNEFLAGAKIPAFVHEDASTAMKEMTLFGATVVGLLIIFIGTRKAFAVKQFDGNYTGFRKVLANKWYVDEIYDATIVRPMEAMSNVLDKFAEKKGIDGIVNGVGKTVKWGGDRLRLLQSGQVGFYIFIMVLGIVMLFTLSFFWIK